MIGINGRYVIRSIAKPLSSAIAIGLLVLLADRLVRMLDVTLGKKNSVGIVFEMLAYLVPHYLGIALPAALFIGLLFGFNSLSRNSELDAFMAAGVGLHQLARPVMLIAAVFTLMAILIIGWVQPQARYAFRAIMHTVQNVEIFFLAEAGVFMQVGNRTFILDKLSRSNNKFERIFLFEDKKTGESTTLTSTGGKLVQHEGDPRSILRLRDGHRLHIEGSVQKADKTKALPPHIVGEFNNIDTPIGRIMGTQFRARGKDHRELTLLELFNRMDNPPKGTPPGNISTEIHKRVVTILSIMILPILAIPFSIGRRRGHRGYRFALAVIILVAYHEILERGALATQLGNASAWFAIWLPFIVLLSFSLWQFYAATFTMKRGLLEPAVDWLVDGIDRTRFKIARKTQSS